MTAQGLRARVCVFEQLCYVLAGSWASCAIAESFWVSTRSPVLGFWNSS